MALSSVCFLAFFPRMLFANTSLNKALLNKTLLNKAWFNKAWFKPAVLHRRLPAAVIQPVEVAMSRA
jgi:hypothetical protein